MHTVLFCICKEINTLYAYCILNVIKKRKSVPPELHSWIRPLFTGHNTMDFGITRAKQSETLESNKFWTDGQEFSLQKILHFKLF